MKTPPDQDLLQRARQLKTEALADIYDQYSTPIFRYAFRLLGDADLAEDCVAETFNRFVTSLAQGGGPQNHLRAYLYRVAHNWIVDHYRSRANTDWVDLKEDIAAEMDTAHEAQQQLEKLELRQLLMRLPYEQRQVIVLRYLEEWPAEEVAESMNKTIGAVKALQHRGIAALQRLWDEQSEGKHE